MKAAAQTERRRIAARAAEWIARGDAGLDDAARAELGAWRDADPAHAAALAEATRLWGRLDRPREAGVATAVRATMSAQLARRRRRLASVAAVAGCLVLGAFALLLTRSGEISAPVVADAAFRTRLVQPERRTLPDGSTVEFAAGSEFTVDFGGDFRRVNLARGVAHFTVVPDSARPFVVGSGSIAVRAVGTAFTVRPDAAGVTVLVTEGSVAVQTVNPSGEFAADMLAIVSAGESTAVPHARESAASVSVVAVGAAEISAQQLWRETRVEFSHASLAEVAAEMNRHNRLQLVPVDPTLAGVRLSGVFRADDAETLLRFLQRGFGVAVERTAPDRAELRRAPR